MSGTDSYADRLVTLRGGLVAPVGAYVLLVDLEARGCDIVRDGESLVVGPSDRLTDSDRAGIRRWKFHLMLLLGYCARPGRDAHLFRDDAPREARHA